MSYSRALPPLGGNLTTLATSASTPSETNATGQTARTSSHGDANDIINSNDSIRSTQVNTYNSRNAHSVGDGGIKNQPAPDGRTKVHHRSSAIRRPPRPIPLSADSGGRKTRRDGNKALLLLRSAMNMVSPASASPPSRPTQPAGEHDAQRGLPARSRGVHDSGGHHPQASSDIGHNNAVGGEAAVRLTDERRTFRTWASNDETRIPRSSERRPFDSENPGGWTLGAGRAGGVGVAGRGERGEVSLGHPLSRSWDASASRSPAVILRTPRNRESLFFAVKGRKSCG